MAQALWTNANDGNRHQLIARRVSGDSTEIKLTVRKPHETAAYVATIEVPVPEASLFNAFAKLGPSWHELGQKKGETFRARRIAILPGPPLLVVCWSVSHSKVGDAPYVIRDTLSVWQTVIVKSRFEWKRLSRTKLKLA